MHKFTNFYVLHILYKKGGDIIKNTAIINDCIFNYYKHLFFYNKCIFIFKNIIKRHPNNVYLKDDFGPCSEYIFNKLINYYKEKSNVYIIFDDNFNIKKINALYIDFRYISTSLFYFDHDLSSFYYKKSNKDIEKLIKLKKS